MLKMLIKKRIPDKIAAMMLLVTLTFVNVMLLAAYFVPKLNSYATSGMGELENQNNKTQHANVEFDAYFIQSGTKVHSIVEDLNNSQRVLSLDLQVLEGHNGGYLKDAHIELVDANGATKTNFDILSSQVESNIVESMSVSNKYIALKQVNNGTQATIEIPIGKYGAQTFNLDDFNKNSKAILKGTYVDNTGKETRNQ